MVFQVITNTGFQPSAGFTQAQFRKLDELYCRAAEKKTLTYRTVECDFDEGIASYTYYQAQSHAPSLQFIIRRLGPKDTMYELYGQGRGRIAKSGVFDRVYTKLMEEIQTIA